MSTAAAHAAAFYREVARTRTIWAIRDPGGFSAPIGTDARRAMPFCSSRQRALAVIASAAAYVGFEPVEIPWPAFCARWIPGLLRDGLLAGVNWASACATGFDVDPRELQRNVEHHMGD